MFSYIFQVAKRAATDDSESSVATLRELNQTHDIDMTTYAEYWKQQGRLEGEARGEARGEKLGRAHVLQTVLAARFGPLDPDLIARLESASAADSVRWALRATSANSLDDVFA